MKRSPFESCACSACAPEPAAAAPGAAGGVAAPGTAMTMAAVAAPPPYNLRREILFLALAGAIATGGAILVWSAQRGAGTAGTGATGAALPSWALPLPFFAAWLLAGWNVLAGAVRNILRGLVFDELFLMGLATLGAFAIGQYEEAVGVMVFYKIGELLQESAVARSRASVRALLDLRPETLRLRREGAWVEVPAAVAAAGDLVLVLPGERVPVDGIVETGRALVDTKALTGEPAPRDAHAGTELAGGFIALDGALEIRALRPAGESQAARIVQLVEKAQAAKARTEKLVTRLARYYTPAVVGIAAAIAFLPPLLLPGALLKDWFYRALVMLVISCPCALVISIPLGYFGGIGGAARRGILVKGGEVLEALARADTAVFDKTGTLTRGLFEVIALEPAAGGAGGAPGEAGRSAGGRADVAAGEAVLLSLAAAAESRSRHPLAAAIRKAALARGLSDGEEDEVSGLRELAGRGVDARIGNRRVLAGNRALLAELAPAALAAAPPAHREGDRAAATEILVVEDSAYAGRILVGDLLKPGAAVAVESLRALGVGRVAILTGDGEGPARAVGAALGIGEVRSGLLPADKLAALEGIMEGRGRYRGGRGGPKRGTVLFIGDGINDAPVIARADVGIAMGAGADVAVETADLVLMTGEPGRVAEAVARARKTRRIVIENIVFALAVKLGFLVLGAAGVAGMWVAVIGDVGVALLAVLNATRALR